MIVKNFSSREIELEDLNEHVAGKDFTAEAK